jgi:hypothetical protein
VSDKGRLKQVRRIPIGRADEEMNLRIRMASVDVSKQSRSKDQVPDCCRLDDSDSTRATEAFGFSSSRPKGHRQNIAKISVKLPLKSVRSGHLRDPDGRTMAVAKRFFNDRNFKMPA